MRIADPALHKVTFKTGRTFFCKALPITHLSTGKFYGKNYFSLFFLHSINVKYVPDLAKIDDHLIRDPQAFFVGTSIQRGERELF